METPYFSIILPTYNRALFLPKAIESVLWQTFTYWELIIVDDGSTDNTKEVVSLYNDTRIKYVFQENKERSAARNHGIDISIGQYICFLDSDDYYKPERLHELHQFLLENNNFIALVYTDIVFEKENETAFVKEYTEVCTDIYERIINDIIGTPQVCVHSEILKKNKFNEAYNIAEDLDLWTRIAATYNFVYFKSPSVVAVEHEQRSINNNENNFLKALEVINNIFSNVDLKKIINKNTKQRSLYKIHQKIAAYYEGEKRKAKAVFHFIKSMFYKPFNWRNIFELKHIFVIIFK